MLNRIVLSLCFVILLTSCVTRKVTKNYDHYLGESSVSSGIITFPGFFDGESLQFFEKADISKPQIKTYSVTLKIVSYLKNKLHPDSKMVFLINNTDRIILKCKHMELDKFGGNYDYTHNISSCKYPIRKSQLIQLSKADSISLRAYLSNNIVKKLSLDQRDVDLIKEFVREISL